MAGSGRRKVVVELPDELRRPSKSGSHAFLAPCILGFSLALVLILVPIFSAVYWACKDVDPIPPLECPRIVATETKAGKLGFLQKRKADELVLELPPPPKPSECSCRLLWASLGSFATYITSTGSTSTRSHDPAALPITCTPSRATSTLSEDSLEDQKPDPELLKRYFTAFTSDRLAITSTQQSLIQKLDGNVHKSIPDFEHRASSVRWGGSGTTGHDWYAKPRSVAQPTDLETLSGGKLYYSYLRIMKWPNDLSTKFPFKLCTQGCHSEDAIQHTLEFREKFKPWLVTPSVIKENGRGGIYFHGFSHPRDGGDEGAHSLVWLRPGRRTRVDDVSWIRSYVNTLERAVAASMKQSDGRIGKFNAIIDGSDFSWGLLPSRRHLQAFVTMLQDHFPDRLGMVVLTNLGRLGEIVVKLFLPLLSEEVRSKIHVLPHDTQKRQRALEVIMPSHYVPQWLGGSDTYQFDSSDYYSDESMMISEEEATEYLVTMPYHA